jgi:autotransporter translocation and assembly factor TamB
LNLDLSVPGRAFVRGLGLESEWKGDLKISGNTNGPNVAGVLKPVRGHFALLGKRFRLERGDIRFTGSDKVDPLLDLSAEHQASSLTALVRVTGSASKPKVSLTSRPPLPESEIASQVLFGTDSSDLSAGQSLQLASAIATYSGKGGAVGILDATRRALGVDVINFAESEEDPDRTRLSVGKYVADGVYIEVERGAEEGSRMSTTVEVEVLPHVRIEGGTTESGGNKVGVKWKWDY